MRKDNLAIGVVIRPLILHLTNGSAMTGIALLAAMKHSGVLASFSRQRACRVVVGHEQVPARFVSSGTLQG
jgi:transposase InsO family protein